MRKVLISTTSFAKDDPNGLARLTKAGIEYRLNPYGRKLSKEEIVALASGMDGIIAGTESLSGDVLKQLKGVRVISRCGTGLDNVDLKAAQELGIKVYNTPDAPTDAVAELTLGLILDCLRSLSKCDRDIRAGLWQKPMGRLLKGKVMGIIGYGRIGRTVAKLAAAFGAGVLAYDIAVISAPGPAKAVDFAALIADSDIITLHVPSGRANEYLIGPKEIAKMKKGAYLINASRGGLVDEAALYEALRSGQLAGAGIDTFEKEPYTGKLSEFDNVVLTSHIGSYARESRIMMEQQSVENLLIGLEGQI
jgi:D-3-phosphoglycerate dehydrogenase / 2-oxoglutarate reductase